MPDISGELESLRRENARLRKLLKLTDAEAAPAHGTQSAWFDRSPGPVDASSSPQAKVEFYAALFGARRDVYAIRWENARYGKSGWMPAVAGGWRKGSKSSDHHYLPLTPEVVAAHLTGDIHIGLYPMLPGDLTCWLAADFDGPAAMLDALAYLKAARAIGAPAALEVSRSGVGAHVWIFFTAPVSAALARQVGTGLVREAIAIRGRMDLRSYDRLFPGALTRRHQRLLREGSDAQGRGELGAVLEGHLLGGVVGVEAVPRLTAVTSPAVTAHRSPVEDHEVPWRHVGDTLADRLHDARGLVAQQERELVVDATLAVVQVRVAHPARLDRHCCVVWSQAMRRQELGPLCWSDGGSEFVEGGGQPEQRRGVDGKLVVATA